MAAFAIDDSAMPIQGQKIGCDRGWKCKCGSVMYPAYGDIRWKCAICSRRWVLKKEAQLAWEVWGATTPNAEDIAFARAMFN